MEVQAQIAKQTYLPWKQTLIMPIGDIQYDGPRGAADVSRLKRYVKWGMENEVYFIGMGDFVDFMSPSNRDRLARAGLYDTAQNVIDEKAYALEDEVWELLKPTKGHWIGLLQGHHYFAHLNGETSDTRFSYLLDAPFLGDCAIVRMTFRGDDRRRGDTATIKMWVHHGHGGGGVLPTGPFNKLYHQKARWPNVRIFMQGHVPQLGAVKTEGLDVTSKGTPHIIHEDTTYVVTGGFARAYQQGSKFAGRAQGNYAEKAAMPPGVLGTPVLILTPETVQRATPKMTFRTVDVKVRV